MNQQSPRTAKPKILFPVIVVLVLALIGVATILKRPARTAVAEPVQAETAARSPGPAKSGRGAGTIGYPMPMEAVRESRVRTQEKRKQVQQQVDRTQAEFAARYAQESVDTAWAGPKETELVGLAVSDQIRQLGVEPSNMAVDCKSRMCHITADFPSMTAGDDWFSLYMNNVGEKLPVAAYKYVQNPDGTVSINLYAIGRQ